MFIRGKEIICRVFLRWELQFDVEQNLHIWPPRSFVSFSPDFVSKSFRTVQPTASIAWRACLLKPYWAMVAASQVHQLLELEYPGPLAWHISSWDWGNGDINATLRTLPPLYFSSCVAQHTDCSVCSRSWCPQVQCVVSGPLQNDCVYIVASFSFLRRVPEKHIVLDEQNTLC